MFAEKRRKDRKIVRLLHSPPLQGQAIDFVKEQYYVPGERAVSDYVICEPAVLNLQRQDEQVVLAHQKERHEALRRECPKEDEEFKAGDKRPRHYGGKLDGEALRGKLQQGMLEGELFSTLDHAADESALFSMLKNTADQGHS